MSTNTINTRIQLKYDTLANWILSSNNNFKPLKGEVCIAEIPNGNTAASGEQYTTYGPDRYPNNDNTLSLSGLSPYAIGIKVGDGTHTFVQLPWIQAIAGDVYGWAKAANKPTYTADEISGLSNYISGQIQDTDTVYRIQEGTGTDANKYFLQSKAKSANDSTFSTVSTIDLTSITSDIAQLQSDLTNLDVSSQIDTKINALDVNNITGFGAGKTLATLTETDGKIAATFQNISITRSQISDAGTAAGATVATTAISDNDTSTDLTTKSQVATYVASKVAGLTGAMHFIGISTTSITDGGTQNPTINNAVVSTKNAGDVVLYNNGTNIAQEFVWTGSAWELLGDEGSYVVKGSIVKSDLSSALQTEIDGKLNSTTAASTYVAQVSGKGLSTEDYTTAEKTKLSGIATGAQVNTIEKIQVPNGNNYRDLTITANKEVRLANIAETGSIYDVTEKNTVTESSTSITYLVFNCGDASHLITNPS